MMLQGQRQKTLADVLNAVGSTPPPDFTQEYFLAGSVLDSQKDALVHRLMAISDSKPQQFFEHEVLFGLRMYFETSLDLKT